MEEEFVTYEQALALKELGFDEECFGWYVSNTLFITYDDFDNSLEIPVIKAPLKQQTFRWFREKYDLYSYIFPWIRRVGWGYDIPNESSAVKQTNDNTFTSYEEAENACIDKLIEIAKQ